MRSPGKPVQLGTRIFPDLHKKLRLHCVQMEITQEEFVTQAIEEKLTQTRLREAPELYSAPSRKSGK